MKKICTLFLLLFSYLAFGQTLVDFEEFNLGVDSFLNGRDGSGGFHSGTLFLPNDYNPNFDSWMGWSISSMTDTTTPGFTNGFSAITGSGYNGSTHYAISFFSGEGVLHLKDSAIGGIVNGFYITNGTYAYLSMRDGDSFAKKFGGVTGNDPDFFLLTIKKYKDGLLSTNSVDIYLADYRFADNSQDYILSEWTYVDLTSLGDVDSLSFRLTSSDVGSFGINTPTYFCMDNFETANYPVSTNRIQRPSFRIFPNPATEFIEIDCLTTHNATCLIYNSVGKLISQHQLSTVQQRISLAHLPRGQYFVSVWDDGVFQGGKLLMIGD